MSAPIKEKAAHITHSGLMKLAQELVVQCRNNKKTVSTAESCTGGLLSSYITSVSGSSAVFDCAFITYSYQAKMDMLDVLSNSLDSFGAVSEEIAVEMLKGALARSGTDISVAITGIAGPGGGTQSKPVGTICFAWGDGENLNSSTQSFSGDRESIRLASVAFALHKLLEFMNTGEN